MGLNLARFWRAFGISGGVEHPQPPRYASDMAGTIVASISLNYDIIVRNIYLFTHTNTNTHTHIYMYVYNLRSLKFTLKHLNAPTYFDHTTILRQHTLFLVKYIISNIQ